jgi:hypothetical protein
MRRLLVLLLVVTLGVIAAPTATAADVASSAREAAVEARAFRQDINATLTDNLATYRDRLSPAERTRMQALARTVDRDLGDLQRATATASRLAAKPGVRAKAHRAAQAAVTQFDAGYAKALRNLAELQPILLPRLSIFEALRAKSELDTQLARYAALGERIKAVERQLRA